MWSKGNIGFHQHGYNKHMQTFTSGLNIHPGSHIFVPLCGKSLDMIWLANRGYRVTGVEVIEQAVKAFFEENKLSYRLSRTVDGSIYSGERITIYCTDFFKTGLSGMPDIDAVYDRASLIALPPAMRSIYVDHLTNKLSPGTRTLLVTLDYPQQEMSGPPFSVTPAEITTLYGSRYHIDCIHSEDCLVNEARFRQKGLTRLDEHVFLLEKKTGAS